MSFAKLSKDDTCIQAFLIPLKEAPRIVCLEIPRISKIIFLTSFVVFPKISTTSVYRIAWVNTSDDTVKNITFKENIELPDVDHDLDLIIKMLNYRRERKSKRIQNVFVYSP